MRYASGGDIVQNKEQALSASDVDQRTMLSRRLSVQKRSGDIHRRA
jgi:hypothetical protein